MPFNYSFSIKEGTGTWVSFPRKFADFESLDAKFYKGVQPSEVFATEAIYPDAQGFITLATPAGLANTSNLPLSYKIFDGGTIIGQGVIYVTVEAEADTIATQAELDAVAAAKAGTVDVQTFTASGTWIKPAGAKTVLVTLIGGGGAGGSGRRGAAGTARGGGGGGSGGAVTHMELSAALLTGTVPVTVPVAAAGGAAVTVNDTNGNIGGTPGFTTFGAYVRAQAGNGGNGGTTTTVGGGVAATIGTTASAAGGNGSATTIGSNGLASQAGGGGGGGGGISAANAVFTGGDGTNSSLHNDGAGAGTKGLTDGTPAGAGAASAGHGIPGSGAGGGASSITAASGSGAAGGLYGGAGGGGAAGLNGFNSGAGGNGAPGLVQVVTYF